MKSIYINLSLLLIVITVLSGCEKTADIETPEFTPKLVIHSFISPDDTLLRVHVSTTKNIYGKIVDYPQNLAAIVTLIDGDKEILFDSRDSDGFCSKKYQIEAGKEYKILVKCDGYPDISAVSRVPTLNNYNMIIDTLTEFHNDQWGSFKQQRFQLKFSDLPGRKNYYNIYAISTEASSFGVNTSPLSVIDPYDKYNYTPNKLISDNLTDGNTITTDFNIYFSLTDPNLTFLELTAYILETDMHYFKYHTSLRNYNGSDEPFTEFSPVYSNVSGGYGIFASYVRYKKVMKLK